MSGLGVSPQREQDRWAMAFLRELTELEDAGSPVKVLIEFVKTRTAGKSELLGSGQRNQGFMVRRFVTLVQKVLSR